MYLAGYCTIDMIIQTSLFMNEDIYKSNFNYIELAK